ncbi:rhodanese-like domain-containing protein [Peptococcaceae bacterium 1198_IL3148]
MLFALGVILLLQFTPVRGLRTLTGQLFKQELKQNENNILIDVREPAEYQEGYISGAINIPLSQFKARINEISPDKPIFLYCRSGHRSKRAARIMSKNGFENIVHLQGGIRSWDGNIKKGKRPKH